jgi:hypothetical protein
MLATGGAGFSPRKCNSHATKKLRLTSSVLDPSLARETNQRVKCFGGLVFRCSADCTCCANPWCDAHPGAESWKDSYGQRKG